MSFSAFHLSLFSQSNRQDLFGDQFVFWLVLRSGLRSSDLLLDQIEYQTIQFCLILPMLKVSYIFTDGTNKLVTGIFITPELHYLCQIRLRQVTRHRT